MSARAIHDEIGATLTRLRAGDAELASMLDKSYGYVVFPSVTRASALVGGAFGRGEVFERGEVIGVATVSQLTVGLRLGGQRFSEVIVFDDPGGLESFKRGSEKTGHVRAYARDGARIDADFGAQTFLFRPNDDSGDGTRAAVKAALERMQEEDPGLRELIGAAHGYAVFPRVKKGSALLGGAVGHGEVFERGRRIGRAVLHQVTLGVQLGAQTFDELILFANRGALERFMRGKVEFAANASAVVVRAGAASSSSYSAGTAVFVHAGGGLMLEAAVGGQKFRFTAGDEGARIAPSERS